MKNHLKIVIHPKFHAKRLNNDICLVKTKEILVLDGIKAKAVRLPNATDDITDEGCQIAGWGKTESKMQSAVVLKVTDSNLSFSNFLVNTIQQARAIYLTFVIVKGPRNFRKFISQERPVRILI